MIRFYVQNLGEKVQANAPASKMEERGHFTSRMALRL